MKKVMITGAEGFVGHYLINELSNDYNVIACFFQDKVFPIESHRLDVTDMQELTALIRKISPDIICHLAAQSSGGVSYDNPYFTYTVNVMGTLNILESVRQSGKNIKVFIPSSSDVYGVPDYLPIDEKHPLRPTNPYSSSKVIIEQIARQYNTQFKCDIVISRSFNHTGIGQDSKFFVPTVIREIKNAPDGGTITMGNLAIMRDFLDVRDVVRAYRMLIGTERGVYNVAGNNPLILNDIVEYVIKQSGKHINISIDPAKVRKNENLRLYGSFDKLNKKTGWKPEIHIEETIRGMYHSYE